MKPNIKFRAALVLVTALALLLCGCAGTAAPVEKAASDVSPLPTEEAVTETPAETSSLKRVQVATVDELLAAIAPDTEIFLEPGEYVLSSAENYGGQGSDYYHWSGIYDEGSELVIENVSNMTILAGLNDAKLPETSIVTTPRIANVLCFEDCTDIKLSGLVVGHTQEPGTCEGGVLKLEDILGFEAEACELFGCGTLGIDAQDSENIVLRNSVIRHCTAGAVRAEHVCSMLLDNCAIYDCGQYVLFDFESSADCAVLNSEIYENDVNLMLMSYGSKNINLLGCSVTDNSFTEGVFGCNLEGAVVEGCQFTDNSQGSWYSDYVYFNGETALPATDMDKNTLDEAALEAMSLERMSWEIPAAPEANAGGGEVTVSTVDELLAAIAPNTTIYLEDGEYDLSTAENFGSYGNSYYYWGTVYDGSELVINGVNGLSIIGSGKDKATISTAPRYANVLRFENCDELNIASLTVGHTEAPGECSGGVIYINDCDNGKISDCVLYGCGTIGVDGYDCEKLLVENTEIRDCSYHGVWLTDCEDVNFNGCYIHDIETGTLFEVNGCENIYVDGKPSESSAINGDTYGALPA